MNVRRGGAFDAAGERTWAPALVVVIAFGLRLGHVWAMRRSPYFAHPVLDAETYYQAALALATGQGYPDAVFWQPPGYPYFLALVYAVAGPGFLIPRLVQAATGAASALLTCWIGTRSFGPRVGLGAGLGTAAYGTLLYFDGELLTPSLAIALQLVAVVLAVKARSDPSPLGWLAAGLFGGLTALVNAPALVLIPVMAAFARRRAAWVLLGAALALAPATLRNWTQGGELVLISSNSGINLYLGNNPRYEATVAMRPGRDWQALLRAPRQHGVQGARAASAFFVDRVLEFGAADPVAFLRLQAKKLHLLASGNEILRNQEIYPARAFSPVLWLLLWKAPWLAFPFGVLLPLAVVGLVIGARRAPMLAAMLLALSVSVLAFFVTARYRAPLVPFLLVFAAEGARWFVATARSAERAVAGLAVLLLFAVANLGQGPMPARMNPDAEFGLATWLEREGRPDAALAGYRMVTQEAPTYWDAWFRLGQLLEQRGRDQEAAEAFRAARAIVPEYPDTLAMLARQLLGAKCFRQAAAYARKAIDLDPRNAIARASLQEALTGPEAADAEATASQERCPPGAPAG